WQLLCERTGAKLRVVPIDDDGDVILDAYHELLGPRTKLVAVTALANVLAMLHWKKW
ncbi:hypothetical protein LCGC14_2674610, partial [marine sediment metagenome]